MTKEISSENAFRVFRFEDAPDLEETSHMEYVVTSDEVAAGLEDAAVAGADGGNTVRTLFSAPGFSLTYAWFKSGFPLPRHSHDCDCLYYIVAGRLQLGTEDLGPGDGFFVPANKAYTYVPGPNGVEVLEFRNEENFDIKFLMKNAAMWKKLVSKVEENKSSWVTEERPSQQLLEKTNH